MVEIRRVPINWRAALGSRASSIALVHADPPASPKIAFTLSVCIFGATAVALVAVAIARGTVPWILSTVVFCGIFGVALTRPFSTQLSPTGISRRTWSGRELLRWVDVESVEWQPLAIILKGKDMRFIVPLAFYYDAEAAVEYVRRHLAPHLR